MKKLFFLLSVCGVCLLESCSYNFNNAVLGHDYCNEITKQELESQEYRIVGAVTGTASSIHILGVIGGLSSKAQNIYRSSYDDMLRKAELKPNQAIINVTIEKRYAFFILFSQTAVHTTGTVIEFPAKGNKKSQASALATTPSAKIYKVGDIYKIGAREIGIVVDVSADGKHGKIIYYGYQARAWSKKNNVTGANNSYDGVYNCKILSDLGIKDYPAAALSGDRWYLPSAKEVALVFENIESINASLTSLGWYTIDSNQKYWTSTETSANEAIAIANKVFVITNKDERANVIVMSTF